jgi:prophage antirepressor-like protein
METKLDTTLNSIFTYGKNEIRSFGTSEEPWFMAKDIATILEYKNTREAILCHVDDDDKSTLKQVQDKGCRKNAPLNSQPHSILINESGIYSLIMRSNMEEAKKFKRWVTSVVLTKIRKTGSFELENQIKCLTNTNNDLLKRRFIIENPAKQVKMTSRLISLQLITSLQTVYIKHRNSYMDNKREVFYHHPDYGKYQNKILNLSKRLSSIHRENHKKNPDICKKNRSNIYTQNDFDNWGDKVILDFFEENPLHTWNIDWKWYSLNATEVENFDESLTYEENIILDY